MKLVYCILDYHSPGGTDRTLSIQANYFAEKGHEVHIVSTENPSAAEPFYKFSGKIKFHNLKINYHEVDGRLNPVCILKRIYLGNLHRKRLSKLLETIKPDITVGLMGHETSFLASMKDGSRKVAQFHFFRYFKDIEYKYNSVPLLKKWFAQVKEFRKWKHIKDYDAFVVLTKEDAENWKEFDNVYVIPNALPFDCTETSDCENKLVLSVGRLVYQKGYDILVRAWKKVNDIHKDWKLVIYGKGEDYDKITEEIKINNLQDSFLICPPAGNIQDKYKDASIYVLSSRYEGFGMVLMEAMSCGVPSVSFTCPCGPSDIVKDGEDGFLVPVGDVEMLAERICRLIENDELRKAMGQNARNNMQRYSVDKVMKEWEKLFERLL